MVNPALFEPEQDPEPRLSWLDAEMDFDLIIFAILFLPSSIVPCYRSEQITKKF
jgi:hypothetical protein